MAEVNSVRDCKPVCVAESTEESLLYDLNSFYTRFEKHQQSEMADISSCLTLDDPIIINTDTGVRCLKRTQIKKAAGPDNICGHTMEFCAEQLGGILQQLF
ncbi:hypothetical protein ABVT39_027047 [Epinephelus coioides]